MFVSRERALDRGHFSTSCIGNFLVPNRFESVVILAGTLEVTTNTGSCFWQVHPNSKLVVSYPLLNREMQVCLWSGKLGKLGKHQVNATSFNSWNSFPSNIFINAQPTQSKYGITTCCGCITYIFAQSNQSKYGIASVGVAQPVQGKPASCSF